MKKLIYLLLIVTFVFASCNSPSEPETTKSSLISETKVNVTLTQKNITKKEENTSSESTTNSVISTTKKTDNRYNKKPTENIQNSSPMIAYFTLSDLKEVKQAYDTMDANDFMAYMENEKFELYIQGFGESYENSCILIEELCNTTLPVLDGNSQNVSELAFYWQINQIDQLIFFDETKRASVIIYTPNSTETKALPFTDVGVSLENTFKVNGYTINIYDKVKKETSDIEFYAEVISDDIYMVFRSADILSVDDFSTELNKLEFIKINDLLEQTKA